MAPEGAVPAFGGEKSSTVYDSFGVLQYKNNMPAKDMFLLCLLPSLNLINLKLYILQFILLAVKSGNECVFVGNSFLFFLHQ